MTSSALTVVLGTVGRALVVTSVLLFPRWALVVFCGTCYGMGVSSVCPPSSLLSKVCPCSRHGALIAPVFGPPGYCFVAPSCGLGLYSSTLRFDASIDCSSILLSPSQHFLRFLLLPMVCGTCCFAFCIIGGSMLRRFFGTACCGTFAIFGGGYIWRLLSRPVALQWFGIVVCSHR